MNYLWMIIIIIIGFIVYMIMKPTKGIIEPFMPGPCPNCGKRNKLTCFNCPTCGWCVTPDGHGECVPGDQNGPFFRQDCIAWQHRPIRTPLGPRGPRGIYRPKRRFFTRRWMRGRRF